MTIFAALLASFAVGPTSGQDGEAWALPSTLDEFFDGSRPRVIAHRGFSAEAPENTMAAIQKAIDLGADMVEFDVLLSRDGAVVVIHDEDLERTTDGEGLVAEHDLDHLQKLDAGSWFGKNSAGETFRGEPIPTLDEVLTSTRGRILVNVEIKTEAIFDLPDDKAGGEAGGEAGDEAGGGPDAEVAELLATSLPGRVAELIRQHDMVDRVIVSSFDPRALDQIRRVAPEIRRASLYEKHLHAGKLPTEVTSQVAAHAFNAGRKVLTDEMLANAASAGLPVSVYTVNERRRMEHWIDRGVSAIFTDRPDVMIALLRP